MQFSGTAHKEGFSMAWSHSHDSSPLQCLASSPCGRLAAAAHTGVLLFSSQDTAVTLGTGSCTALSFSSDSATLGAVDGNSLRCWRVDSAEQTASVNLPESKDDGAAIAAFLVPVGNSRFAAARGRLVIVAAPDGSEEQSLVLDGDHGVHGLEGGPSGLLCMQVGGRILIWSSQSTHNKDPTELLPTSATAIRASPNGSFLAATTHTPTSSQVQIWNLDDASTSSLPAEPIITFDGYNSEVTCLAWDDQARYLATSEGAEATVWDVEAAAAGQSVQSVVCCGHSPKSQICHMAFQPGGAFLATAGSDGRLLMFDCGQFQCGGVVSPAAAQQVAPVGASFVGLTWLPGGRVIAATRDGEITALQLGAAVAGKEPEQAAAEESSHEATPSAGPNKLSQSGPAAQKPDQESPPASNNKLLQLPATPSLGEMLAHRPSAVMMSEHDLARMDSDVAAKHGARRPLPRPIKLPATDDREPEHVQFLEAPNSAAMPDVTEVRLGGDKEGTPVPSAASPATIITKGPPRLERRSAEESTLSPLTPKFMPQGSSNGSNTAAAGVGNTALCSVSGNGTGPHDSSSSMQRQESAESANSAPRHRAALAAAHASRMAYAQPSGGQSSAAAGLARLRTTEAPGAYGLPHGASPSSAGPFYSRPRFSQDGGGRGFGVNGRGGHLPGGTGPPLARSTSLGSRGTRDGLGGPTMQQHQDGTPVPRPSALSPALLQHIQAVKENPHTGHHLRSDLAGWGPGPVPPLPTSPPHPMQVQYMVPYSHTGGHGPPPHMYLHAGPPASVMGPPPPQGGPYAYYPLLPQHAMGGPPPGSPSIAGGPHHGGRMLASGPHPPSVPMPASPGRAGQPRTPQNARPPPPSLPRPGQLHSMLPPDLAPLPGGGMPPGPMVFVPTGAQPPQGWAPVMAPPPQWMGVYGPQYVPGQPPGGPMHTMGPAPPGMPPQHYLQQQQPPHPPALEEGLTGLSLRPRLRYGAGFRSAPPNLSREQIMRGPPGTPQGSSGSASAHRTASGDTSIPSVIKEDQEEEGEGGSARGSEAASTDGAPPDQAAAAPAAGASSSALAGAGAVPAMPPIRSGAMMNGGGVLGGFEGFRLQEGLLWAEGGAEGDPGHPVTTLYIGNLPPQVDEYCLMATFQYFGPITNAQVIRDKSSAQSRGFAFVTYAHPQAATNAQAYMNGMSLFGAFGGRPVRVGPSNRA